MSTQTSPRLDKSMIQASSPESHANMRNWIILTLVLFPILLLAGMFMRSVQGNLVDPSTSNEWFYPMMTLHGIGMAGAWWIGAMAAISRSLSQYVKISEKVSRFAFYCTILGVALLLASVFIGKFAAGWYFLYPLPLKGGYAPWSIIVFFVSLVILTVGWFTWTIDLLRAIASKWKLREALGWSLLFTGKKEKELPAVVLIATITLVSAVACWVSGAIAVALFFYDMATGQSVDPLLMKNLIFLFGHLVVNLSLYLAVGVIYDTLPKYTNRPWGVDRVVTLAWNVVWFAVIFAYFHHLYMDFEQPKAFHYLGQVASYVSALPSAVVTVFGGVILVYKSKVKWNLASSLLFLGMLGWAIGGIGAVIDSTISVNSVFHNTLWVPAHFHTYMIVGLVLMVLGYFYHYVQERSLLPENLGLQKLIVWLFLIGGYGFVLMFFLSGATGVPRRFQNYPPELAHGATHANIALGFISLILLALILYFGQLLPRLKASKNIQEDTIGTEDLGA